MRLFLFKKQLHTWQTYYYFAPIYNHFESIVEDENERELCHYMQSSYIMWSKRSA